VKEARQKKRAGAFNRRALALYGIGQASSCIKNHLMSMISVDPLASLDIFGQQRISIQEPHLTKSHIVDTLRLQKKKECVNLKFVISAHAYKINGIKA